MHHLVFCFVTIFINQFDGLAGSAFVTDIEKHRRMVTSITVHHRGTVFYTLSFGAENSAHVECEIKLAENLEHKKAGF